MQLLELSSYNCFLTLLAGGNLVAAQKSSSIARSMTIIMAEIYEEDSAKLLELRCCGGNYDSHSNWAGHPDQHSSSSFLGFLGTFCIDFNTKFG